MHVELSRDCMRRECKLDNNKCNWSMEVSLPTFLGNHDDPNTDRLTNQPANQQADMRVHREVKLPIIGLRHFKISLPSLKKENAQKFWPSICITSSLRDNIGYT